MIFRSILFTSFIVFCTQPLFSQNEPNKLYFVITKDGNEHIGNLEGETDLDVTLRLRNQEIVVIQKTNIRLFEPVTEDNFLKGKYVAPNPFANRYLTGSSSIPPGKNRFLVNTTYALAYTLDYGINDVYSLGLSTTLVGVPVLLNGQANYKVGNQLYFGATATGGWLSWADPAIFFGYGGVRLTSGSRNNNYTIGGGFFSVDINPGRNNTFIGNVSLGDFGYINFSAMKRYTKKLSGHAEVWVLKNLYLKRSVYMINVGSKIQRRERSAWSFFVSTLAFYEFRTNDLQVIPIPCIAWCRNFGKK